MIYFHADYRQSRKYLKRRYPCPVFNLMLCCGKPATLKSFVQRRGRARSAESKLVMLLDSTTNKLGEWQQLELDMKAIYEKEMRGLKEVLVIEDSEAHNFREFRVPSMGALLDFGSTVKHLYHCPWRAAGLASDPKILLRYPGASSVPPGSIPDFFLALR